MKSIILLFLISSFFSSQGMGWGKRGHEIVSSVAARILEEKKGKNFLRGHEFDLGYYANVPDIIWRKTAAKLEPPMHYIDWTKTLEKIFGTPENLPLEFKDYKEKLGSQYNIKLGVVPYRIHGLMKRCLSLAKDLSQDKQGPLLVCLGVMGHYTGDLSMPLHVTDNYDGQMTGQKGVHVYFESDLVDQLDPELKVDVMRRALDSYSSSKMFKMTPDEAVRSMIADSYSRIPDLFKIDKTLDRKDLQLAKNKFKSMIEERLVQGAILTARVWESILENVSQFDEDHFSFFDGTPDYIEFEKEL